MNKYSARFGTHEGRIIRSEVQTPVSPWQAWLAWTDPAHLSNWLLEEIDTQLVVGEPISWPLLGSSGRFNFIVKAIEDGCRIQVELLPSRQLIEVEVEGSGGASLVSITHSGFSDSAEGDAEYQEVVEAWQLRANVLKLYLSRYFGRSLRLVRLQSELRAPFATAQRYLLDPEGLAKWLTIEGEPAPLRESSVTLWDGTKMTAQVLVSVAHSLMVGWNEIEGLLLLRCRSRSPGVSQVSMDLTSWMFNKERFEAVQETLEVSLSRLVRSFSSQARIQGSSE